MTTERPLDGTRTAVVTGAAGAIGIAIAARLAARGFHVIAVDRDADGLAALPASVAALELDLTDPGFQDAVRSAVERRGGLLDLLVHNAGIVVTGSIEDRTPEASRREQVINLQAPILLTEALYPALRRSGGLVVGVGSAGAVYPMAESPGYSASKAGLRSYLLALAVTARRTGVRVAMVHPGSVDTPMLRREAADGGSLLNFLSKPLTPDFVAQVVEANVDRVRLETFLPRSDRFLTLLAAVPQIIAPLQPFLERLGRRGLQRFRSARGIGAGTSH